jgi:HSP20 family protein
MPLFRLDPDMDRWREDMTRMWTRMAQEWGQTLLPLPVHHVAETADAVIVEVELPGVDPGAVELDADADSLTVRGTWPPPPVGVAASRRSGRFDVTVGLPADVDPDAAQARFHHGLLTVELPKAAGPRRRLAIRVEGMPSLP